MRQDEVARRETGRKQKEVWHGWIRVDELRKTAMGCCLLNYVLKKQLVKIFTFIWL